MRKICLGSTATDAGALLAPYTTAGREPFLRKRRASFLPRLSRPAALTLKLSVAVAISLNSFTVYQTKSLLTEVSSWIDRRAEQIKPAMERTSILGSFRAASDRGIVFVTTTFSSGDLEIRSI